MHAGLAVADIVTERIAELVSDRIAEREPEP